MSLMMPFSMNFHPSSRSIAFLSYPSGREHMESSAALRYIQKTRTTASCRRPRILVPALHLAGVPACSCTASDRRS